MQQKNRGAVGHLKIADKLRAKFIHILGGFTTREEALEDFSEEEKMLLFEEIVAKLFTTIGPQDLLHRTQQGYELAGKFISEEEMKLIIEEARFIAQSKTWADLQNAIRYEAVKKMYYESQSVLDITAGKLMLFQLKILAKRLEDIIHGRI